MSKFTKQHIVDVCKALLQSYKITVCRALVQSYRNSCWNFTRLFVVAGGVVCGDGLLKMCGIIAPGNVLMFEADFAFC